MRLTLRTLLAYLDDTLVPAEAKMIGEKVAESEIAPEIIERIAKATRRRGLSAPLVTGEGDDSADPNTVAEYLDNTLPADQVAEIEEAALESDARLAEVAACHQILTLVLGEPAKVPPTARQRMYRIVKGKESIPYRKTFPVTNVAGVEDPDDAPDEMGEQEVLLPGMKSSNALAPIGGALLILLLLSAVIYAALPSPKPVANQGYVYVARSGLPDEVVSIPADGGKKPAVEDETKKKIEVGLKKDEEQPPIKKTEVSSKKDEEQQPKKEAIVGKEPSPPKRDVFVPPPSKPDLERRPVARLESKDSLLLQRKPDSLDWERAAPGKELNSSDSLLSLPGLQNDIKLESGVRLQLWGMMPEYMQIDELDMLESRVKLHVPPIGVDADFTLQSGRVFVSRPVAKDEKFVPARVRVRFREEQWDIVLLDPETEVCLELFGYYSEGAPFSLEPGGPSPTTEVQFALLSGRAGIRLKFREYPMLEAPTRIDWDSTSQDKFEPKKIAEKHLEWWNKGIRDTETARQIQAAAVHYVNRFRKPDEARFDVAFYSAMQDPKESPGRRLFAVRTLQAIDSVRYFADALADDAPPMRWDGIRCTKHWTGLAPERDLMLYRVLIDEKSYTEKQANDVLRLLHPFAAEDYAKREIIAALFEAMRNEKVAVRELAYKHMQNSDRDGAKEIGFFDAAAPQIKRDAQIQAWKASWKRRFIEGK